MRACRVIYKHESSISRGFGFVIFATRAAADAVLAHRDEHYIRGSWVDCKSAILRREMEAMTVNSFQPPPVMAHAIKPSIPKYYNSQHLADMAERYRNSSPNQHQQQQQQPVRMQQYPKPLAAPPAPVYPYGMLVQPNGMSEYMMGGGGYDEREYGGGYRYKMQSYSPQREEVYKVEEKEVKEVKKKEVEVKEVVVVKDEKKKHANLFGLKIGEDADAWGGLYGIGTSATGVGGMRTGMEVTSSTNSPKHVEYKKYYSPTQKTRNTGFTRLLQHKKLIKINSSNNDV